MPGNNCSVADSLDNSDALNTAESCDEPAQPMYVSVKAISWSHTLEYNRIVLFPVIIAFVVFLGAFDRNMLPINSPKNTRNA